MHESSAWMLACMWLCSSPPSSRLNIVKADNPKSTAPAVLTSSDVQDLQQKYLYLEREISNGKSESRQGPAFRALVRGLDDTEGWSIIEKGRDSSRHAFVDSTNGSKTKSK